MQNNNNSRSNNRQTQHKPPANYTPMADAAVDDNNSNTRQNNNIVDKFGSVTVVTASFHQLLSFLLRQLGYLSKRDEKFFGSIVAWANSQLVKITKSRDAIRAQLDEISYAQRNCASASELGCEIRCNNEGENYFYSRWYSAINKVPRDIADKNTMTLGEARCTHLLDQICYRLNKVHMKIDTNGNCDYDFTVMSVFNKEFKFYDDLRTQAQTEADKLAELQQTRKTSRESEPRTPRSNQNTQNMPSTPRKNKSNPISRSNVTPRKINFDEDQTEMAESNEDSDTTKKVYNLPPSKPVTKTISFASMAKNSTVQQPETVAKISDDSFVVEDLNDETPMPVEESKGQKMMMLAENFRQTATNFKEKIQNRNEKINKTLHETFSKTIPEENKTIIDTNKTSDEMPPGITPTCEPSSPNETDFVQVRLFTGFLNNQATYTNVIMTRAQYANIPQVGS